MLILKSKVRRGGQIMELEAAQLVPGDIVVLEAGDRVPADGKIIGRRPWRSTSPPSPVRALQCLNRSSQLNRLIHLWVTG